MPLLGREAGTDVFRDLDGNPERRDVPGHRHPAASTGRSSSRPPRRSRIASASWPKPTRPDRALVLDLEGVNFIDSQGSAKLTEIHQLTQADGVELRLAGVKPQVRAVLDADGVVERIGADHIHGNVQRGARGTVDEGASTMSSSAATPEAEGCGATGQARPAAGDGDVPPVRRGDGARLTSSAVAIARAARISVRWLNAWGKLPTCRRRATSYSSASRPRSLASPTSRSNSARASSTRPLRASAFTSQNEQARNWPSSPGRPSSVSAVE